METSYYKFFLFLIPWINPLVKLNRNPIISGKKTIPKEIWGYKDNLKNSKTNTILKSIRISILQRYANTMIKTNYSDLISIRVVPFPLFLRVISSS